MDFKLHISISDNGNFGHHSKCQHSLESTVTEQALNGQEDAKVGCVWGEGHAQMQGGDADNDEFTSCKSRIAIKCEIFRKMHYN